MKQLLIVIVFLGIVFATRSLLGQEQETGKPSKTKSEAISFKSNIFPIIKKNCLPCHSEDNYNPSELSLDDYELMSKGGKNGALWVGGKPEESVLMKKLGEDPPFGERMPLNSKRKIKEGKAKYLTDDEVKLIATWIEAGAKNN